MPSRYFEGNAQPEQHSNVGDFYCQIYFEAVDTVANCIAKCFNLKDYSMYANCDQVLLKELWKILSHKRSTNYASSTQSLTLILYEFSYLYGRVLSQFQAGEGGDTLHDAIDFLKKNKKYLVPHTRGHVLGRDYSGYASNKCQL